MAELFTASPTLSAAPAKAAELGASLAPACTARIGIAPMNDLPMGRPRASILAGRARGTLGGPLARSCRPYAEGGWGGALGWRRIAVAVGVVDAVASRK